MLSPFQLTDHRTLPDIKVGDRVTAKHKNGRYYNCDVVNTAIQEFYEVDFEDGSFSDNMYPEDIEVGKYIENIELISTVIHLVKCVL